MKANNLVRTILLLGAVGCGSDSTSPSEACNQIDATICARIYECYTAADIAAAGLPASESACITQEQAADGCAAKTTANACTGGNAVYHGENVGGCLDQLDGLTCAEVMSNTNVVTGAPKCAELCLTPT